MTKLGELKAAHEELVAADALGECSRSQYGRFRTSQKYSALSYALMPQLLEAVEVLEKIIFKNEVQPHDYNQAEAILEKLK